MLRNWLISSTVFTVLSLQAGISIADDCVRQVTGSPLALNTEYRCTANGVNWGGVEIRQGTDGKYFITGYWGVAAGAQDGIDETELVIERFHAYGLVVVNGVETEVCGFEWGAFDAAGLFAPCTARPNRLRMYINPQEAP